MTDQPGGLEQEILNRAKNIRDGQDQLNTLFIRMKRMLTALIVGAIAIAVLTVAVVILAVVAVKASDKARSTAMEAKRDSTQLFVQCEARDQFKTLDLERWDKIISFSGPPKTPQQAQQLAQFQALINASDAQENCTPLLPKP